MPVSTVVNFPAALIMATNGLLLLHVPPEMLSVNKGVVPMHTEVPPFILPAEGIVSTVIEAVVLAVPHVVTK